MVSLTENPLTGEPDAGNPPVRFGGRGDINTVIPTSIGDRIKMCPERNRHRLATTGNSTLTFQFRNRRAAGENQVGPSGEIRNGNLAGVNA